MPVKVVKRGKRWRVVEGNGKIATTSQGNARDGGGHTSKAGADAQARAINASLRRK